MNIVLLGAPGAGKGTQAQKLVEEFGFDHVSTGDLLRAAVKEGTDLGKEAKTYMDAGQLVPDEVVVGLVKERLGQEGDGAGILLDGFPRNTAQAKALDEALAEMGATIDAALLVSVVAASLKNRLSSRRVCRTCGYTGTADDASCPKCSGEMYQRDDDKPETVQNRLDVYAEQTAPLVGYYQEKGLLREVDGDRPVDDVYVDVKDLLSL